MFGVSVKFKLNSEPLSPSVAASFQCIGVVVCDSCACVYIIFYVCARARAYANFFYVHSMCVVGVSLNQVSLVHIM